MQETNTLFTMHFSLIQGGGDFKVANITPSGRSFDREKELTYDVRQQPPTNTSKITVTLLYKQVRQK